MIKISHGTVFNIAFAVYAFVGQTIILDSIKPIFFEEQTNFFIGVLLFAVLIAEVFGIAWKIPQIYSRAGKDIEKADWVMFVWIAHMVVGMILTMLGLQAVGIDHNENQTIFSLVMFAAVIRELIILVVLSSADPAKRKSSDKELVADIILFVFACVAYTAAWEAITGDLLNLYDKYPIAEVTIYFLVTAILFLIFFLPTRMTYLIEDWLFIKTKNDKFWWFVSLVLAVLSGLSPMIF